MVEGLIQTSRTDFESCIVLEGMKMFKLSLLAALIILSVASGGLLYYLWSESVQSDGCEANDLPCDGRDSPLEASQWLEQSESVQPDGCEANDLPCDGRDSPLEASQWLEQSESVQPDQREANDLPCNGRDSPLEESSVLQGKLLWVMQNINDIEESSAFSC